MWKSATFQFGYCPIQRLIQMSFRLNFRSVGIRFFHNPLPSVCCKSLTILLPRMRGIHRAYQVSLTIDTIGLGILLSSGGSWVVAQSLDRRTFPIRFYRLFYHSTSAVGDGVYKGSASLIPSQSFPSSVELLCKVLH